MGIKHGKCSVAGDSCSTDKDRPRGFYPLMAHYLETTRNTQTRPRKAHRTAASSKPRQTRKDALPTPMYGKQQPADLTQHHSRANRTTASISHRIPTGSFEPKTKGGKHCDYQMNGNNRKKLGETSEILNDDHSTSLSSDDALVHLRVETNIKFSTRTRTALQASPSRVKGLEGNTRRGPSSAGPPTKTTHAHYNNRPHVRPLAATSRHERVYTGSIHGISRPRKARNTRNTASQPSRNPRTSFRDHFQRKLLLRALLRSNIPILTLQPSSLLSLPREKGGKPEIKAKCHQASKKEENIRKPARIAPKADVKEFSRMVSMR
ncbi:hypothetical protein BDY21DRAFT_125807 [Lineolata rhizophorae]|uniref:Uncharacterized protein n=1 Tax=Lineolata rhizophorae TaxID=578093 RepID=A0A6A6NPY6_9PEZI|nr:hypothetical protein BDY21DRAFT_125807 [Lineolata rhizophorae]